uniref:Putative secreted protein n=1 Tax=Anopheles triannulatus TaxID=58253 RepID=A0A2M4B0T7_9DIPT
MKRSTPWLVASSRILPLVRLTSIQFLSHLISHFSYSVQLGGPIRRYTTLSKPCTLTIHFDISLVCGNLGQ